MRQVSTRVRTVAVCGALALCLVFPPALAAERRAGAEHLLLWVLGLRSAREQETPRKIDINSASVDELAAVPGLGRPDAQRITRNRPYAKLHDLKRAGLSLGRIEHLAPLLTVEPAAARSGSSSAATSKPSGR